jgi:hypothetical protein
MTTEPLDPDAPDENPLQPDLPSPDAPPQDPDTAQPDIRRSGDDPTINVDPSEV